MATTEIARKIAKSVPWLDQGGSHHIAAMAKPSGTEPQRIQGTLGPQGWPAVLSLRLIPAVPFSVLNYAAGASAVRVGPYLAATFVGVLPGTAAVVVLGDALTGTVSPLLMVVSLCTAAVGIAGLVYEFRGLGRRTDRAG